MTRIAGFKRTIVIGAVAWCAIALVNAKSDPLPLLHVLFLLAPLVIVPLSTDFLPKEIPEIYWKTAGWIIPVCAILVVLAFYFRPGWPAASLCLPWLIWVLIFALRHVISFFTPTRPISLSRLVMPAAWVYLLVGAVWLIASRAGVPFMGFGEPIVMLTAVHFHFAGFGGLALVIASKEVANSPTGMWRHFYSGAVICMVIGMPLVAAGISTHHALEGFSAFLFSLGVLGFSSYQFFYVKPFMKGSLQKILLSLSSFSTLFSMGLSILYGYGRLLNSPTISIPTMIMTHGLANALGFLFCGLIAYHLHKTEVSRNV